MTLKNSGTAKAAPLARIIVFAFSSIVIASSASAQDEPGRNPEVMQRLFDCREIVSAEKRLACFDAEVALVQEATVSQDLLMADREQVRGERRGLFGLTLPKIRVFGDENDDERIDELNAVISSFSRTSQGRAVIVLEGGAQWTQTDSVPIFGTVGAGDEIVIKSAALGSYIAKIGNKRAFKVERLR